MFDLTRLLVAPAMAQAADSAAPVSAGGLNVAAFMNYAPFVLIFAVFYFLIIRPQQKKMDEQTKMIKALQRGDRVVTSGGIHGKVVKIESDNLLIVEIADGVQIKLVSSHVQALAAKTPVANGNDSTAAKSA